MALTTAKTIAADADTRTFLRVANNPEIRLFK